MAQQEQTGKDSSQTMHKVLIKNYDKLISILNSSVLNLSKHFVAKNIITIEDEEEIRKADRDKARLFLVKIEAPVKGGFTAGFHIMLDVMFQYGSVTDRQLAEQIRNEIDEECKNEKLEEEIKKVDVRRQEHISSLTLQLKKESEQKAVVEQLQVKIAEVEARHKQMDCNLDKEKENNRRLYMQYLKTLKELQNLRGQLKVYIHGCEKYVNERLKTLTAEKTSMQRYTTTIEQDRKELQEKCKIKDLEISSLKEQLEAVEVGLKKDDEEWRNDYDALKKEHDLLKEGNEDLQKDKKLLEQEVAGLKGQLQAAEVGLKEDDEEWRKDYSTLKEQLDSLKEANEELQKDKKLLEHEVDDLKDRVKAAELAFKKDDEEWRQDYYKINKENESLKEETDSLKQEVQSLRQEKDTLKIENDKMKEENEASHQNHVDAVLLSHKKDHEEWNINYQSLSEKCDSLKAENDKLLKQQLEVALIGRRTAIEEMETSVQTTQQENAVLKVIKEEADKEIMLLNNDKSMLNQKIVSLEEQLQSKIVANETANRELAEVKARLVSVVEENQRLHQSASVELHSKEQWLRSQQSLRDMELQVTRTRAENERVHRINGELFSKTNALQNELLSTKAQLALQKEQDAKLIHTKTKKEEELKATVNKLNQKIELLEEECVKLKQSHSISTRINQSPHSKTHTDNSKETDNTSHKTKYLLTGSPTQSLSAPLHQSRSTAKSNKTTFDHPVPQATASLKLGSISDVADQDSLVSNSLPSLHTSNTSYATPLYGRKTVSNADGKDAVMCKQFIDMADLFCGQRVIVQRTNDIYEYGVVRAFPQYINGNMNFVGIELDLPSMFSQVAKMQLLH